MRNANYYLLVFDEYLKTWRTGGTDSLSGPVQYVLSGGGHRIRPQLTMAWCEACGGNAEDAAAFAMAVELVHTMSLIHDDLPCMDDAKERRGKASLHSAYDEETAVLCGDALLATAFLEIVSGSCGDAVSDTARIEAARVLSMAARNMADGQHRELWGDAKTRNMYDWLDIHTGKTASLLAAACELGAIVAGASDTMRTKARRYGFNLGIAYQLLDDLRDGDGVTEVVGEDGTLEALKFYKSRVEIPEGDTRAIAFLRAFSENILSGKG